MPYEYLLQSPEKVEIRYEIGGVGSRALAAVMDDLLVLLIVGTLAAVLALLEDTTQWLTSLLGIMSIPTFLAGVAFITYLFWFSYYIVFEIVWNGQTPGKRVLGLRVMMLDGTPVTPTAIFVRELVRLVDAFPICIFGYNVAGLLAFFNPYGQRLGDMLAGTFVVKERKVALPTLEQLAEVETAQHPMEIYLPEHLELTAREYQALRAFLDRREQLPEQARRERAEELYTYLYRKLGLQVPSTAATEKVLEAIATRYARERGRIE